MKSLFLILTAGIALYLSSCSQPVKKTGEGQIQGQEYTSKEIGWTITIPKGWDITDVEKANESTKRGVKAIEETINAKVDYSGYKNLISFQKNPFNIF